MVVENDALVLRKPAKKSREGWAQASKKLADVRDDGLVWPEFANEDDEHLVW